MEGLFKKKPKEEKPANPEETGGKDTSATGAEPNKSGSNNGVDKKEIDLWVGSYDFIPGSKILFYDDQNGEKPGEFPSRWDLYSGNAENALANGEHVILFNKGRGIIFPLVKDGLVLPEKWTIEFDCYFRSDSYSDKYWIEFVGIDHLDMYHDGMDCYIQSNREPKRSAKGEWVHVSVSFNTRSLKAYFNEERVLNVPNYKGQPKEVRFAADYGDNKLMIKNVRIAEGAKPLYEKEFMEGGKLVTNNILFDVNKATLRPRSYAEVNRIAELMKQHSDVNFSIEGHTDSDGSDSSNNTLSEQRAEAVKKALQDMGIDARRMSAKGWGESKPIAGNDTPEGKALNRRVEFVKI